MDINSICQDEKCSEENENMMNWYIKKYNIIEMLYSFNKYKY